MSGFVTLAGYALSVAWTGGCHASSLLSVRGVDGRQWSDGSGDAEATDARGGGETGRSTSHGRNDRPFDGRKPQQISQFIVRLFVGDELYDFHSGGGGAEIRGGQSRETGGALLRQND